MPNLRSVRKASGLSQIAVARNSGVSKTRLQMAEADGLVLNPDELAAVYRILRTAIEYRTAVLASALVEAQVASTTT